MAARGYIGGRGPCRPPQWATGPCRGRQAPVTRWVGDRPPFLARDLVANLKKKITLRACRPMGGDRGYF